MKTILIFEPRTGGHREHFIRCLTGEAHARIRTESRILFFTAREAEAVQPGVSGRLASAGRREKRGLLYALFLEACRTTRPDHVLILELTHLELSLALYGAPVPVSAILFVQYPELPFGLKRFLKQCKTALLLHRAPIRNLFLLNGEESCRFLERCFGSRARFIPIPDPLPAAEPDPHFVLRDVYGIAEERRVFLFFGAVSRRKGAEVLIKALHRLAPEAASKSSFVFCGEPERGYHGAFARACAELRAARPDLVLNIEPRFVSDAVMAALFEQSDVILMPYLRPEYSSGVLALAAKAGNPVIGPDRGLLGRLIRTNGLGAVCAIRSGPLRKEIESAVKQAPAVDPASAAAFAAMSSPQRFAARLLDAVAGGN